MENNLISVCEQPQPCEASTREAKFVSTSEENGVFKPTPTLHPHERQCHPRYMCFVYPFTKTGHWDHCPQCQCYICGQFVDQCSQWSVHCHANPSNPLWSKSVVVTNLQFCHAAKAPGISEKAVPVTIPPLHQPIFAANVHPTPKNGITSQTNTFRKPISSNADFDTKQDTNLSGMPSKLVTMASKRDFDPQSSGQISQTLSSSISNFNNSSCDNLYNLNGGTSHAAAAAALVLSSMMKSIPRQLSVQQEIQHMQYQTLNKIHKKLPPPPPLLQPYTSNSGTNVGIGGRISNEYSYNSDNNDNSSTYMNSDKAQSQVGKEPSNLYGREYAKATRGTSLSKHERRHGEDLDEMGHTYVFKTSSGRTSMNSLRSSYGLARHPGGAHHDNDTSTARVSNDLIAAAAEGAMIDSYFVDNSTYYDDDSDDSSDKWQSEKSAPRKSSSKQLKKGQKNQKSKYDDLGQGADGTCVSNAYSGGQGGSNPPALPVWLSATGEKQHSEKQLQSGVDLSRTKKKYRMSLCLYCAKFCPSSPWATMKSRKYEHEIFKKHEKSFSHVSAAQLYLAAPAVGVNETVALGAQPNPMSAVGRADSESDSTTAIPESVSVSVSVSAPSLAHSMSIKSSNRNLIEGTAILDASSTSHLTGNEGNRMKRRLDCEDILESTDKVISDSITSTEAPDVKRIRSNV